RYCRGARTWESAATYLPPVSSGSIAWADSGLSAWRTKSVAGRGLRAALSISAAICKLDPIRTSVSPGVILTILTEPSEGTNVNGCKIRRVEEPQAGTTALQSTARPRTSASNTNDSRRSRGGLHAEQEPAPAVFSGRGLVK